jgi:hypothetical protein
LAEEKDKQGIINGQMKAFLGVDRGNVFGIDTEK